MKPGKCAHCREPIGERWLRVQIHNARAALNADNFCRPECIMGMLVAQGYKPAPSPSPNSQKEKPC